MRATGIVRRIDDLGRIVIPKEIRRNLRIRESDPIEIFTDAEGGIVLKKYSPIGEITAFAKKYAESLYQVSGFTALITDRDQVIAVSGGHRDMLEKALSKELEEKLEKRETLILVKGDKDYMKVIREQKEDFFQLAISPILCEGDVMGAVILLGDQDKVKMGEVEKKLVRSASEFLGRQMEQ